MKAAWLLLVLLVPLSQAAPLRLTLQQQENELGFHYHFNIDGQPQQLSFNITQAVLAEHFRQFRPFRPALLQHYLWRDIQLHVAQHPGITLQRRHNPDTLEYRLHGGDHNLIQQLNTELAALHAAQTTAYLQREYYAQIRLPGGQQAVIPDHPRLMQDSLPALLPVATALHAKVLHLDIRQAIGYISQWLQQIPYQAVSDRRQSAGASFRAPLQLLRENRGDCDSKAVLLAGLIRMLLPDIKQAMIYLPQHAVLAVQIPARSTDSTVTINGHKYVLIDATGPALLPPGQIAEHYKVFTQTGGFAYQLL